WLRRASSHSRVSPTRRPHRHFEPWPKERLAAVGQSEWLNRGRPGPGSWRLSFASDTTPLTESSFHGAAQTAYAKNDHPPLGGSFTIRTVQEVPLGFDSRTSMSLRSARVSNPPPITFSPGRQEADADAA